MFGFEEVVSKEANDQWLDTLVPIKGEFRAFCVGVCVAVMLHETRFGLAWERAEIMYRAQKYTNGLLAGKPLFPLVS